MYIQNIEQENDRAHEPVRYRTLSNKVIRRNIARVKCLPGESSIANCHRYLIGVDQLVYWSIDRQELLEFEARL